MDEKRNKGEHMAFVHAAELCREYRKQILNIKSWLCFTTSLMFVFCALWIAEMLGV